MIYKILFIVGLVWLFRVLFRNMAKLQNLENQQKKPKSDPNAFEAEYTVIDEDVKK